VQRYWVIGATATVRRKTLVQSILPKDSKACKAADSGGAFGESYDWAFK